MHDSNPISSVKLRWLPDMTTSHSTRLSKDDRQVAGYRSLLIKQLVKQLAIPLSNQKTVAKWLVIAIRLRYQNTIAKSLVIAVPGALSASFVCRRLV
jgi:hypothetical protein